MIWKVQGECPRTTAPAGPTGRSAPLSAPCSRPEVKSPVPSGGGTGQARWRRLHGLQCPNRFVAANIPLVSKYAIASAVLAKILVAVSVMKGLGALRGFHTT